METKYYTGADLCMEVADHPGTLTKEDIIKNIMKFLPNQGIQGTESQLIAEAEKEYNTWKHRYEWMIGAELKPASEETVKRIEDLRKKTTLMEWWWDTYAPLD